MLTKSFKRVLCTVLGMGILLDASQALAYYGRIATEARLSFSAELDTQVSVLPRGLSSLNRGGKARDAALEAVDAQVQHLMGTFQSVSFAQAFSYPGVLGETYQIRFTSVTEGSEPGRVRLGYEFTGTVVFDKRAFSRQNERSIPIKLPLQPDYIYALAEQGNLHACTDHHYDSESDFWYFWDPDQTGCSLNGDRENVYRTQGTLTALPNTTLSYPEYDRLYGDNGNGKELRIAIFVGYIDDVDSLSQPMRRDWGMKGYRAVQKFLKDAGYDLADSRDAFRLKSNGAIMSGINFWSSFTKEVNPRLRGNNENINVVVDVLLADTMLGSNDRTFHSYYVDALANADVVIYDGHSGLGGNLDLASLPQVDFNQRKYQIFFFNGCSSYPYFNGMYFDAKGGSRNLDVVTSGLPTIVDTAGPNINTFIAAIIDGRLWSWQTLLGRLETSNGENGTYLVGVKGDEDNSFRP